MKFILFSGHSVYVQAEEVRVCFDAFNYPWLTRPVSLPGRAKGRHGNDVR
jgi:hypothetical protein